MYGFAFSHLFRVRTKNNHILDCLGKNGGKVRGQGGRESVVDNKKMEEIFWRGNA